MKSEELELPEEFGKLSISDEEIEKLEPFFPSDWSPDNPKYFLPDDLAEMPYD